VGVRKEITLLGVETSESEIRKFRQSLAESNDKNHQLLTKSSDFFSLTVFDDQSLVQFIHRNLAYLIVIIYFYMLYFVLKNGNMNLRIPIYIIGISLLFQIVLGVLTILSGVKMIYASLHQINSILIILSTLYFLYITKYKEDIY
jgi:cytochrome c oxidase assembly protein subunit 15